MVIDVLEALACLLVVVGAFLLFGPWALIAGGLLIVAVAEWKGHSA